MDHLSWKCFAVIMIALFSIAMAAPVPEEQSIDDLNPVAAEQNAANEVDREKRKIFGPEVGLGVKNAVLGYVFGKIDGIIDAKTRLIDQFDATNAAKNAQYGIVPPTPINSLQQLLQAVIQPKIAAISSKFAGLSGSSAGSFGGSSGFGNAAATGAGAGGLTVDDDVNVDTDSDQDLDGGVPVGVASSGSGNILGSILKLSGPILASSATSGKGLQTVQVPVEDSDE